MKKNMRSLVFGLFGMLVGLSAGWSLKPFQRPDWVVIEKATGRLCNAGVGEPPSEPTCAEE